MEVIEPNDQVIPQAIIKKGRPPSARKRKEAIRDLRDGKVTQVDKSWLLGELMRVYAARDTRHGDKLRALELIAKISGYGNKVEEPEDERKAINDLMEDLEKAKVP